MDNERAIDGGPSQRPARGLPRGALRQFFAGVAYPFEGLRFIRENGLWGTCAWIVVINIVVFAAIITAALLVVKPWLVALGPYLTTTFSVQSQFAAHLITVITAIVWAAIVLSVIGLSGIAIVLLGQALASPFLDAVSERVEFLVLATPEQPLTPHRVGRAMAVGIGDLFWGGLTVVAVYTVLFLVGLIPGVGTIPATICSYTFAALLAAHQFVGLPLTRRFVNYSGRWRMVRDNLGVMLGFGSTTLLLLVVPGAGFFVLPFASVGGTLLFCDLVVSKRV